MATSVFNYTTPSTASKKAVTLQDLNILGNYALVEAEPTCVTYEDQTSPEEKPHQISYRAKVQDNLNIRINSPLFRKKKVDGVHASIVNEACATWTGDDGTEVTTPVKCAITFDKVKDGIVTEEMLLSLLTETISMCFNSATGKSFISMICRQGLERRENV